MQLITPLCALVLLVLGVFRARAWARFRRRPWMLGFQEAAPSLGMAVLCFLLAGVAGLAAVLVRPAVAQMPREARR